MKNIKQNTESKPIPQNSMIFLASNPALKGMVISSVAIEDTFKYEVFIENEVNVFYSGQIFPVKTEPVEGIILGHNLHSYLTAYQINNPSAQTLYSLNSARIDFVPYQFRPALKIIKSDANRLLIADSVGVGKTIEAGLILKELEARLGLENIIIICPRPLVAERKWELEMKRFDEEFHHITDGSTLRGIISDVHRDGEWPSKYKKVIIPYSLLKNDILFGSTVSQRHSSYGLIDLDPAPRFDLVIVDEAHHIRNSDSQQHEAVKYFCDHANAVVFLTATPLQTSDDNLFTLLNVLRPDIVLDKDTFNDMLEPNKYISRAVHFLRAGKENWAECANEQLNLVCGTYWGSNVIVPNPLYAQIMKMLTKKDISREQRVKLISDVESLNGFSELITRTRRQDIQDFCIRRSHTVESSFTDHQKALHNELLEFECAVLEIMHGSKYIRFMTSMIRRQAASCIFGLAPFIRNLIQKRFAQIFDDPEVDLDEVDDASTIDAIKGLSKHILQLADDLPSEDPKFDSIVKIIRQKQDFDNNKIILYSAFRHTLAYVNTRLKADGYRVGQIDGSVSDEDRRNLSIRFKKHKLDPSAIDILLFTEVGCEGLDYQFCDMMINYDLPWNPMRIEQRIGRIDRRGQQSDVVNIYNMITEDTIDADIYYRCLLRIGVFEKSIGECSEIFGNISREIEKIAVNSNLTDDERQFKFEQMADNEIRKVDEIRKLEEEEKEFFGIGMSEFVTNKEVMDANNPWISPQSIQRMVTQYLVATLGEGKYITGDSLIKTLRVSASARKILLNHLRESKVPKSTMRTKWEKYLKGNDPSCQITFGAENTENNDKIMLITLLHPFAQQSAEYFASNKPIWVDLIANDNNIASGEYPFSLYAWHYKGNHTECRIVPVCINANIDEKIMEILYVAESVDGINRFDNAIWENIEKQHMNMWKKAKDEHIENTKNAAKYKLEILAMNYAGRKSSLRQRLKDNNEKIVRMKAKELENAESHYERKVSDINENMLKADIHIQLLVRGTLTIRGENHE